MKRCPHSFKGRKSGQAIIFLIMVLVIGSIVVLWNFDLHNIVSTKIRIDNAGDAAALSAARWQGITLNMIGELNLCQVAFICDRLADVDSFAEEDVEEVATEIDDSFGDLKRRLSLVGPLMGLIAAQSSAMRNLTERDMEDLQESSSRFLRKRGADFESSGGYYMDKVEAPYAGAWEEYGGLLSAIANGDMMVECGNAQYFLYYISDHPLLSPGFYNDVKGSYVCHFAKGGRRILLDTYVDYNSWDPLPQLVERHTVNCEYFSTDVFEYQQRYSLWNYYSATNGHVTALTNYYPDLNITANELRDQFLEDYLEETKPTQDADLDMMGLAGMDMECAWHYFEQWSWLRRRSAETLKYFPNSEDFPFHEGWRLKDEYNYGGADASTDVRIDSRINTPGLQLAVGDIYWQASAKPFGYLVDPTDSGKRVAPMYYGIVLPAFHDTRLIHNDLSTRQSGVDAPGWDEHMYTHVEEYLDEGLPAIQTNRCTYCETLEKWEDEGFRNSMKSWIQKNEEAINNGTKCNRRYEGNPNMGRG